MNDDQQNQNNTQPPNINPAVIPVANPTEPPKPASSNPPVLLPTEPAPSLQVEQPAVVTTDPKRGKKLPSGKVIATMLGILLMVGAIGTGVYISQRQQIIRTQAWNCNRYTFNLSASGEVTVQNNSNRNEPLQRAEVYINNQIVDTFNVPDLASGESATLGQVTVPQGDFSWRVTGTVDCSNSGNYEIATPTPSPTPSPTPTPSGSPTPSSSGSPAPTPGDYTAACGTVVAYDLEWNLFSSSDLSGLEPGDTVRFAINGSSTTGSFDMARFIINDTTTESVTDQRTTTGEYYYDYEIPDGIKSFSVSAELHHSSLGWI